MDPSKVKVLIVDDEPDILDFISYNLRKEEFQVQVAKNGKEALKVVENFLPAVWQDSWFGLYGSRQKGEHPGHWEWPVSFPYQE